MVDYAAAFKLPFIYWKRFLGVLALSNIAYGIPAFLYIKFMIPMMLSDSATAVIPKLTNNDWLLLGIGIAVMIPFAFYLGGYSLRTLSLASKGQNKLPDFGEIWPMVCLSLKGFAAILLYYLMMAVCFMAFILIFMMKNIILNIIFGIIAFFALLFIIFAAVYLGPMLMARFAAQNRLAALFEWKLAGKLAFNVKYLIPWLVSLGYNWGIYLVSYMLSMMFFVLLMVGGFNPAMIIPLEIYLAATMIPQFTVLNLYGQAYRDVSAVKTIEKNKRR
jgi:hypothetical protein